MLEHLFNSPNFIFPPGTQVVITVSIERPADQGRRPVGAVGVILLSPATHDGPYVVRFPDGQELEIRRHEFTVRKHFERGKLIPAPTRSGDFDQYGQFVILRCIVGSQAYGLAQDDSDIDRRGIYLPPAKAHWSLDGVPEQLENPETQETYWELEKFIRLALKANPNVLECLYTPLVEYASPLAEELLSMRSIYLSKLVYQTYNGYVMSQFKKMQRSLENMGRIKWKHAMHLIRLLHSGIVILQQGLVPVNMATLRSQLLPVSRGELSWDDVDSWRLDLHREFDDAYEQTKLPERPDFAAANAFLVMARKTMVDHE